MGKKTIGVDLDGVLADTISKWVQEAEARFGIKALKNDITKYHLPEVFPNINDDQVLELFKHVWNDYKTIRLEDPEISTILDNLHEKFNIHITTLNKHSAVRKWLKEKKITYDKLTQFSLHTDKHKLEEVDIYIDDFHEVIRNASKSGKIGILLRQPYNDQFIKKNRDKNIFIAYNWREIEDILLENFA